MVTYEERLIRDTRWAFLEGSMHFEKESAVHKTLDRIARKLDELHVPYAVAGGIALFFHGFRRFTEDVAILVERNGLKAIHATLEGRGYLPPFTGSKNLRDPETGVKIEFIVAGDYPGDGKPKPIAFPSPIEASMVIEGKSFLTVSHLVELKLASGMTNPRRAKDLVDVQELIERLAMSLEFAEELHPFVQDKYREIWHIVHDNPAEP
jgi:hypothetical protein